MFPFDCRIQKFKKYNKSLFIMLKIHFYIHFRINLSFFGRAPPKQSFFGSGFAGFRFRSIATQQLRCPYNTLLRTVCMSGNYLTLRLWRRCIPHASKFAGKAGFFSRAKARQAVLSLKLKQPFRIVF